MRAVAALNESSCRHTGGGVAAPLRTEEDDVVEIVPAGRPNRRSQTVIVLLVLFSVLIAFTSIRRSELVVKGHGVVSSTMSVQWVVFVAGAITAVEGAVALMMLRRRKAGAARRALYVSVVTGLVGLLGTILSVAALVLLRREQG